ncbi:hypothetical protein [Bacillus testis]|uniref:hypothetical protein n=1 Tax=Bacillus testis TaxID=1622072 RepID=UPI00067ED266|nr:hypothetical protein [Bacillus testis]
MNAANVNILKWVTGGLEAFLGIPLIGGTVILSFSWTPLAIMFILHIIVVALAYNNGMKATGNILGIVTSVVGWIPFLGMILHILSAIFILIDAAQNQKMAS